MDAMQEYKNKSIQTMSDMKSNKIASVIEAYQPQIKALLGDIMTPERLIQIATINIASNKAIAACSIESIIGAVMQAAILKFKPSNALGYCYFVPYGKELQFQLGYKGMIQLAYRSGKLKDIFANVVYKGDIFEYEFGNNRHIKHIPNEDVDNSDENITHVYAYANYVNGGFVFEVLNRKKIDFYKARSADKRTTSIW